MAAKAKAKAKPEPEATTHALDFDGEVIEIEIGSLTLGEVSEMEMQFQAPMGRIEQMAEEGYMSVITFLAFLAKRRKQPSATLDDIGKVRLASIKEAEVERPTEASETPEGSGTPST